MKIDLKSIFTDHDIKFSESRTHYILKNCPNCNGRDKLFIKKDNQLWQCFKCKGEGNEETRSGNAYKLLRHVVGLDSFQIRQLLSGSGTIEYVPSELPTAPKEEATEEIETKKLETIQLPSNFFPLDCSEHSIKKYPQAYSYLFSRHVVSKAIIRSFDLRFDASRQRLVFPAYKDKSTLVGYQGRDITNRWKNNHLKCQDFKCELFHKFYFVGERVAPSTCPSCGGILEESFYPKSINSRSFPKTEFFFNQQNVDWTKPVVIVEGPFDCINTPNSIGLLGKFLSDTQFRILRDNVQSDLILFLDGDSSGTESIKDIFYKLELFILNIKVCPLDDQDDPGSHTVEQNMNRLQNCVSFNEWAHMKNILV
jgi:hypothetical protein